jgi:hypothetical protein
LWLRVVQVGDMTEVEAAVLVALGLERVFLLPQGQLIPSPWVLVVLHLQAHLTKVGPEVILFLALLPRLVVEAVEVSTQKMVRLEAPAAGVKAQAPRLELVVLETPQLHLQAKEVMVEMEQHPAHH